MEDQEMSGMQLNGMVTAEIVVCVDVMCECEIDMTIIGMSKTMSYSKHDLNWAE